MPTSRTLKTSGALVLALGAAVAFGACSGSTSTKAPDNGGTPAPQSQAANNTPATGGSGVTGAVSALSDIKSFKFTMTMKGGTYGSLVGSQPITGTITTDPPAADMSMMGIQIRQVGGKTYVNVGGSWIASKDASQATMAQDFSPQKMLGSYLGADTASGYTVVGDEQKDGVATTHYTAGTAVLGEYGSALGVTGGTWTADVWIAKDGGYPVSVSIANTGGSSEFLFSMDITNVNDPANVIPAP